MGSALAALAGSFGLDDAQRAVECAHNALGPVLESSADPKAEALRKLDRSHAMFRAYPSDRSRRRLREDAEACEALVNK
jgi:hypothetical protein